MKRHSQEPFDASFKRIRLSTSPGELRLEADLNHLHSFRQVDHRHWVTEDGAFLERQFGNSTRFCLHLPHNIQVWMEFPRQYPHEAPIVTQVVHPVVKNVVCSIQPPAIIPSIPDATPFSHTTIVYNQWSAVRRLNDFLVFLVDALKLKDNDEQSFVSRALVTPTQMDTDDDQPMQEDSHHSFHLALSPNRFDQGYPKTHRWHDVMPRGEMERQLENSDSY